MRRATTRSNETRTLCTLSAALLLVACEATTGSSPPPVPPQEPDDGGVIEREGGRVERAPGVPSYDEDAQPETAAIGSEDLVRWRDDAGLVASDATTDAVYLIDLGLGELTHRVQFERGADPGRVAASEDTAYVVLQGAGELARVDAQGQVTGRVAVCAAPRGVALDAVRERAWVACASSEVVGVDLQTFEVASTWFVDADLRDVVAMNRRLYVSRFHAAEVLVVDVETGQVGARESMPDEGNRFGGGPNIGVLWRMRHDDGALVVSYQRTLIDTLFVDKTNAHESFSGYGQFGGCEGAVTSMKAVVELDEAGDMVGVDSSCSPGKPLPVDVELTPCGASTLSAATTLSVLRDSDGVSVGEECTPEVEAPGNALAMTRLESGRLYVLARGEDLAVHGLRGEEIVLAQGSGAHLGQVLFHGDAGGGIACASCHPEGGSDGRAWPFVFLEEGDALVEKTRRTQTLRAGVEGKLHWDGEFDDMTGLMSDVFSRRMGGFVIENGDAQSIRDWLGQLSPEPGVTPPPERAAEVARGAALFEEAGCDGCHSGATLTDHQFYDVGTAGMLKTPTLRGVVHRRHFLHDGCADTLRARFVPGCGGDQHGDVEGLSEGDLGALTAYLETL